MLTAVARSNGHGSATDPYRMRQGELTLPPPSRCSCWAYKDKAREPNGSRALRNGYRCYPIVPASSVTAVCASAFPFRCAPVCTTIAVASRMVPLNTDVVPSVVLPATCQKIFSGLAPPCRMIFTPELILSVCATWKIHTEVALPDSVTFAGMVTALDHLYRPGRSVNPPIFPAPSSVAVGNVRPAASAYAVCMSPTAAVSIVGVGGA